MNRKALSLFVMGLMLFSVFFVVRPVSAETYTNPAGIEISKEIVTINGTKYVVTNTTVVLDQDQEFWDVYKISAALHLLNSPRIYVAENWNFLLAGKDIKIPIRDNQQNCCYYFKITGTLFALKEKRNHHPDTPLSLVILFSGSNCSRVPSKY